MRPIGVTRLVRILRASQPVFAHFDSETLSAERLAEFFCAEMNILLPKASKEQRWAAWNCFSHLAGKRCSSYRLHACVCRAAAGLHYIKEGQIPPLWDGTKTDAVMQCTGVSRIQNSTKPRLQVHTLCLLGAPAGLHFKVSLSDALLEYVLGKYLGLSFRKFCPAAPEITGCIFKCKVAENSFECTFSDYDANSTMQEMNKKLAEARLSPRKCKTAQLACHLCRKKVGECALAVWKDDENI